MENISKFIYDVCCMTKRISLGAVHHVPKDLQKILACNQKAYDTWNDITPLARNEWVCWIVSAKKDETRKHRILVGIEKMKRGIRRPCCWAGCPHR